MLGTTALQMLAGGLFLGALGLVRGELAHLAFNTRTTIALVYLATLGAIGGFVAYTYALRHLPVSFVSLYAYINPIIAVALGVLLLGEPFNLRIAAAAALVLVGVGGREVETVRTRPASWRTRRPVQEPVGRPVDRASRLIRRFTGVAGSPVDPSSSPASLRRPSANVIVPSTTTLPSTRAMPRSRPIRLRSRRTDRLDLDDVAGMHRPAVAHALDAHEVRSASRGSPASRGS